MGNKITREMVIITPNEEGQECSTCPLRIYRGSCGTLMYQWEKEFGIPKEKRLCDSYAITLKDPKNHD